MSIIRCARCKREVDTDFHPVEWVPVANRLSAADQAQGRPGFDIPDNEVPLCERCAEEIARL